MPHGGDGEIFMNIDKHDKKRSPSPANAPGMDFPEKTKTSVKGKPPTVRVLSSGTSDKV